ncbi:hypothetical protein GQR88_01450 [Burkholderia glumae AU6208]|nr:hypothetical protein GQR88_01450 [Burkholderia glumae AU6208]
MGLGHPGRRRLARRTGPLDEQTKGARFWRRIFNELKVRGCRIIPTAAVDDLKGPTEAVDAACSETRQDRERPVARSGRSAQLH